MTNFKGFTSSETFTQVPDSVFHLLREIDDAAELKVTLYAIWQIEHIESDFRALGEKDFEIKSLGLSLKQLRNGLNQAVERSILLKAEYQTEVFYFLNSPRGRLAAQEFIKGQLKAKKFVIREKSNLFKLYEENIGPLTPLVSDMLREAENNYDSNWFQEAFEIAVSRNVRNWKYIQAILARWKENGKNERTDQQNLNKDTKRYTDNEFSEFINRD